MANNGERRSSAVQPTLQLKDVYETAQAVGEQFQALIQQFGNSYFGELVNTVVDALEHLENFVQDNQKLQAKVCKLLLENDSLLKENQKLKDEAFDSAATLATLESVKLEKSQLVVQLQALQEMNQGLQQQIKESTHTACQNSNGEERKWSENVDGMADSGDDITEKPSEEDILEVPRMRRRIVQSENELKRTKTKLLSSQSTLKCIVAENNSLKSQLEEFKAELGLKSLQTSDSTDTYPPQELPKFYKKDLLVVLKERNELKEQLDALTHELNMAKLRLRHHQHSQSELTENETAKKGRERQGRNTRVRDIVTSITLDSIKIESKVKKTSR